MLSSWKVGTAFGIGIYVHWSFWLLPLWAGLSFSNSPDAAGFMVAGVLALFVCVALHELGHSLAARRFGVETQDITLTPIGGVARLKGMPEDPVAEAVVAVAGPAVNVVIFALLLPLLLLVGAPPLQADAPSGVPFELSGAGMIQFLLLGNFMLVAFNMIPAFPMDGGRVLRALLAMGFGRLRATEVAANVGLVFAAVFVVGGLLGRLPLMLVVIGPALVLLGRQELAVVRYLDARRRSLAEWGRPSIRWVAEPVPVEAASQAFTVFAAPEPDFSGYAWDRRLGAWVVWESGRPVDVRRAGF